MLVKSRCSILLGLVAFATLSADAHAQRDFTISAAPNISLDTDAASSKMLGAARDFLAARQWADAIDLLRQTADQYGERLVAIEPGRYVNVQTSADILLSSLPPEGLKLYRAKVDPPARRWFESAKKHRDVEGLERVVRKAFLSSYGDDALLMLGDIAWEQGALARARSYWEKLLPVATQQEATELPVVLKYPDSEIPAEMIKSRLVLCRLYQGNVDRAQQELAVFREAHSQTTGGLAGRTGYLANLLDDLVATAKRPAGIPRALETVTFAGNFERNQIQPRDFDVGGPLWSVPLKEMRAERATRHEDFGFDSRPDRGSAVLPMRILSYYPVTWKNVAFYCDDTDIYALDISAARGSQPAWGAEVSIYQLPHEFDQFPRALRGRAGLPQYTLTIDGEQLFARLGPATAPSGRNREIHHAGNALVCLGLGREGDLQWIIKSEELESDAGKWVFDGAPIASDGRVYVALRRCDPQLQMNVACFDAATGRPLWNRKVCSGVEALAGDVDEIRQQLLTLAEERLYYVTNNGAIASLDARDGSVCWVATYPRLEVETIAAFNKRQQYGPNPCVFNGGQLFAAPTDCESILAFESETGILKWSRDLSGKTPQLLGASRSRLIAAGDFLWALDVETGRVVWRDGRADPEAATAGRGLLVGDCIYWPRREEIRIVKIATGKAVRQIDLAKQYGLYGGGNLTIAGEVLLLAQSDRLVAFGEFGVLKQPSRDTLAFLRRKAD
jgi:outer membrane protein assembly factor BamB